MNKHTRIKLTKRSDQIDLLVDYTNFLLSEGYADCDVWAEEPTAVDQFMALRDKLDKKLLEGAKDRIISAFPGTGKSYYCSNGNWSQYVPAGFCCDSDSSKFDKTDFPQNYIEHIKQKLAEGYERVFVSSHKEVRDALVDNGLEFTLIYPNISLKYEYINRYTERGNADEFIALLKKNWDNWIQECKAQNGCKHIVLNTGQYVSNVV